MRTLIAAALLLIATAAQAELPSASDTTVRQALASGKPAVIDLGARTCISCKKMAPILESLAGEYRGRAAVLFIDVRQDQAAAQKFRIQMIPTQIFYNSQGKEIKRHVGPMDRAALVQELKAAGLK